MSTASVTQTGGAAAVAVTVSRGLQGVQGIQGPPVTVDQTIIDGSANAVASNAVFDALALKAPIASPTFTGSVTAPRITGRCDGLEVFCKAGLAINAGQVVYVTGASGNNIIIGLAQANAELTSSKTIGISESTLANNATGYVITEGLMTVSISAPSANEGDPIWLSPSTAGGMVFGAANKPVSPNHMVYLGVVTRKTGNNVVEIYVKIQNGSELDELADVLIASPVEGQALMRGATSWQNRNLASSDILGITSQRLIGRHAGTTGAGEEVSLGTGIEFSGSTIQRSALTGDITATAGSNATTLAGTIAGAKTFSGDMSFSSTTRPTSGGTGTPAATSLITETDRRTQEVADLSNVYYRQIMGHELGVWATVGISPANTVEGNSRAGCRFIGTTGLSSASAQGGGIKYPDAGITGGATFSFQAAFDLRFLFRNSLSATIFDVAYFLSLRNNTNFWSASSIGLYHVAQPADTWAAVTSYAVGNRINVSGIVYVCSTLGISGASQPAFNATINGTTNDGTAVWRTLGPHTSNKWALAFVDGSSNITLTDTGVAWVAGTSNTTALRLRSNGSSVFASVNGSTEVSVSRGSLTAATPYIMCRGESATATRIAGLIWTVESANI